MRGGGGRYISFLFHIHIPFDFVIYLLDLDLTFEGYNMKVDFRPMKCVPGDKKKK